MPAITLTSNQDREKGYRVNYVIFAILSTINIIIIILCLHVGSTNTLLYAIVSFQN